jgi:hypothetical protein
MEPEPRYATVDRGHITKPERLENTYTTDTSLQRALSCEMTYGQTILIFFWLTNPRRVSSSSEVTAGSATVSAVGRGGCFGSGQGMEC